MIRAALCLKIHQFEDTGAIVAASTTSLPEFDGSGRNWDYRFCWLRDTYYVITSLNHIGHFEEMEKYFHYVTDICFSEESTIPAIIWYHWRKKINRNAYFRN